MKALVTGAAGFVGSNIVRKLLGAGFDVVGIDSLTDYYDIAIKLDNLKTLQHEKFTFYKEDLNTTNLDYLLSDVEFVFHQAGQPGVRKSWGTDFSTYIQENIAVTQALLEAAKRAKYLRKFVYASSSSVYGDATRFPTSEEDRPQPLSPYGVTKLAAEHLCTLYAQNFQVPTVSLRYFTVYGPGQRPDMAFTRFVKAMINRDHIQIYGTGEQIRDFTYVDDVVEANFAAALSDCDPGAVFNVAGGTNISVLGAIGTLERIAEKPLNVEYVDRVAGDVVRTGGSTKAIQAALGWGPMVSLEEGLTRHYEWGLRVMAESNA